MMTYSKFVALGAILVCLATAESASAQTTMSLTFAPVKATDASASCPGSVLTPITKLSAKGLVGSTKKTDYHTVGILFYSEGGTGILTDYTNAKLLVTCRGNGTVRVVTNDCFTEVAVVSCYAGIRPAAQASLPFLITGEEAYDVQVKADVAGEVLEFAEPKLIVY